MIVENNYLFSRKLEVGQFYDAKPEEVWIELREVGGVAAAKMRKFADDTEGAVVYFLSLLSWMIVDHNLWKDEANKYTADEVAEMVGNRAELCLELMNRYFKQVLFIQGNKSGAI
jgi:hypothetical protein